ncbi:6-carboxyhexanoate--CoA ligase [Primorskyibacter flagellatus]|uniref:6-carboxyhexanoate--CoA ligase n=1 Tax=Primorskyibacter flagellatus TaxID=1387277 RepID=A0A917EDV5_9RHOB|nr:acetate--CoA ligase [Primorskyibacter flagellatus]GGE27358.1 6-carboxyhexanoate--CoA ligase [Primorskyibacter flagellatus]
MSDLDALISPRRVALVGASDTAGRLTARPQAFLAANGFKGEVVPVNPRRDTVQGLPAAKSVAEAGAVDHAYILLDADPALEALADCAAAGVRVVSMLADGFAEAGPDGAARQARATAIAREAGIRLIGPNSTGVVHMPSGFVCTANAAFAARDIESGGLSVLSQSGSMIGTLASRGAPRGIGFAALVSLGNEAATDVGTLGSVLLDDPATQSFALFLETLRDPAALERFARDAHARGKPVVAYVIGQSDEGRELAVSHTGAIAGAKGALSALLRDIGIVEVTMLDALLETPGALVQAALPPARPRTATVLTTTGGGGGMVLDRISAAGATIAGCGAKARAALEPRGVPLGSGKLIDVTMAGAKADVMQAVVAALLADPETGLLVVAPGSSAQTRPDLTVEPLVAALRAAPEGHAPMVAMPLPHAPDALRLLSASGIPAFATPESVAEAVAAILSRPAPAERDMTPLPDAVTALLDAAPDGVMDEVAAGAVFDALGIRGPAQVVLPVDGRARDIPLRFPVVAKLVSSALPHKTEAGAIRLNLPDTEAVASAVQEMLARVEVPVSGVLVQEMAHGLGEALIGLTRDPCTGPMVTLAAGGVLAEVLGDAALRPAPATAEAARAMTEEIRSFAPLRGYRGYPTGDLGALANAVAALSRLALHPRVQEAEINPALIGADGVLRLDALVRLGPSGDGEPHRPA